MFDHVKSYILTAKHQRSFAGRRFVTSSFVVFSLIACSAMGANHFVRKGATGTGDGSDWANACPELTGPCAIASLVRGDTYYIAGGSYAAQNFNRAENGTSVITIKKATVADHGTNTGWADAYGTSQAVFVGGNSISTGYWDFNGVSEYGIMFDFSEGQNGVDVGSATNVSLRYIDFDGITQTGNYNYTAGTKGIVIGRNVVNLFVSHCAIHGGESLIQEGDGNTGNGFDSTGTVVEYSHLYAARSTASAFHSNVYFLTGSQNGTFRYNRVHNYNDEGVFFTGWEGGPVGWKVYGNVFWSDGGENNPRGVELRQSYNYSGNEFYNNTFVNLGVGGILNRTGETGNTCTGCIAKNNLSYNSPDTLTGMTASSNTDDGINRFVNLTGLDFRLSAALAGEALAAPYNYDLLGNVRGADGVWDRGAYEFGAAGPQPPTNLTSLVK